MMAHAAAESYSQHLQHATVCLLMLTSLGIHLHGLHLDAQYGQT